MHPTYRPRNKRRIAKHGFRKRMAEREVQLSDTPDGRVRAVTHLDVDRAQVDEALEHARSAI